MKRKITLSILLLVSIIISFLAGAIVSLKYFAPNPIPLINGYALDDSHALLMQAMFLESLYEGKEDKLKDILYIEIKTKLEFEDDYDGLLCENNIKAITENRVKIKKILDKYPDPTPSN